MQRSRPPKISVQKVSRKTGWIRMARWRDETGRHRGRSLGQVSGKALEAAIRSLQEELGFGSESVQGAPMEAAEALRRYLRYLERVRKLRPATVQQAKDKLTYLLNAWSDRPMGTWRRMDLEELVAEHDWSGATIGKLYGICRRFITWCKANGITCPDFVGDLKAPRHRAPEKEVLTLAQLRKLLDVARGHRLELPIALAVFVGLSRADLYALTWKQVDLRRGWISLPRSKTGKPIRCPIIPPLRELLEAAPQPRRGQVCRDLYPSPHNAARALRKLLTEAEIPEAPQGNNGWHRFRHSCGTILAQVGVPHGAIARILAHAPAMVSRYIHHTDGDVEDAMGRLASAWSRSPRGQRGTLLR